MSEQPYPEGKVSWRPLWSVLVVFALFVGFGVVWSKPWSSGPGGPTDAACKAFPPSVFAPVVGTSVSVIEGVTGEGPTDARGCYYSLTGRTQALEVWVVRDGATAWYNAAVHGEERAVIDDVRDVSGPGFQAYQTIYDTGVLDHGIFVTVGVTSSPQLGVAVKMPGQEQASLLERLRGAILKKLH